MSVSNGDKANATTFNSSFMSREVDTSTIGKVDLNDPDSATSGATVANVQKSLNGQASFTGAAPEGAKDQLPTWNSSAVGTPADNVKDRADALTTQVNTNNFAIAANTANIGNKVDKVSSTDNGIVRFDGAAGAVQNSTVTIDDSGNMIVSGNLTVQGDTTTINTATLDVEDSNITVNKTGDQATADTNDAGLRVEMSDATDAQIAYDSTLTSKFKAGEVGSEVEIVTTSAAQVVTAKDIDGGTASNTNRITLPKGTKAALDALTRKQATLVYATDESKPYIDNGTDLIEIAGGGSGQGGINYVTNYDFESSINDVAAVGTGASVSANTVAPVRGTQSLDIDFTTAAALTPHVRIDLNAIDLADVAGALYLSFEYTTSASYVNGLAEMYLYNNDSSQYVNIRSTSGEAGAIYSATTGVKKFTGVVYLDPTDTDYELRLFCLAAPASDFTITIDNIKLTPQSIVDTPIVSTPQDFTPSFTNFTLGNGTINHSWFYRDGNRMKGAVNVTLGSTSSLSGKVFLTVPDGKTLDTNLIAVDDTSDLGSARYLDFGTALFNGRLEYESTTTVGSYVIRADGTYASSAGISATIPFTWTTSDSFEYNFDFPILEWANSSAVLSTTEMLNETAKAETESTGTTSLTSTLWTKAVCDTNVRDTQNLITSSTFKAPRDDWYLLSAGVQFAANTGGARGIKFYDKTNAQDLKTPLFIGASPAFETALSTSKAAYLAKGQEVEVYLFQSSGGNLNYQDVEFQVIQHPNLSVYASYSGPQTITKYTSGSGTYTTPANCAAIKVKMVGGGGGGGGAGSVPAGSTGTIGTASTFGSVTAFPGTPGANLAVAGVGSGGTVTGSNGLVAIGGFGCYTATTGAIGGQGGSSALGGAGYGGYTLAGAGQANTGGGGGGGGAALNAGVNAGNGGGAGGYTEFVIVSPSSSYSYAVGTGGAGGAAGGGTSASAGNAGGSGVIIIEEYY